MSQNNKTEPNLTTTTTTPYLLPTPNYTYTDPPPPKPLIQYQRRHHQPANTNTQPNHPPISRHQTDPTPTQPTTTKLKHHPMTTRSSRPPTPQPIQINLSHQPAPDPTTYKQAYQNPAWQQAMKTEIQALHDQETWILVPPPNHHTILGSKWTYKTKLNPDGSVSRYKARLVAQGYRQSEGRDYTDTFSPVAKITTIRLFFILALQRNWNITQLDISNAFLHGRLEETVYMAQPKGFEDPLHPSHVCLLKKSLYGLKQSSRQWNLALTTFLKSQHFTMSSADPSLYILHQADAYVYLLIYVDDILITGTNDLAVQAIITSLSHQFNTRTIGQPKVFLGIETDRFPTAYYLHQTTYASSIVHLAGLDNCTPVNTPLPSNDNFHTATSKPFNNPKLYRKIVGSLQYLVITRPDIAHAVNIACQFMHAPQDHHFSLLTRIIRYVKGTISYGLPIIKGDLRLTAYTDSDWAGDPTDRTSTTGYCIFLGPNLLTWKTQKQKTVARSSSEAEYRALSSTVTEIIWIKRLLQELHVDHHPPTLILCDNTSAISIAKNPILKARTKHVEIDHHFIREHLQSGSIAIHHISTKEQIADIFTKRLPHTQFKILCDKLTIKPKDHQLAGG